MNMTTTTTSRRPWRPKSHRSQAAPDIAEPSRLVPSTFEHPFLVSRTRQYTDGYSHWDVTEWAETTDMSKAMIVSSLISDGPHQGKHSVMVDVDIPAAFVPSSTPGHGHLYIDAPMAWRQYRRLLKALHKAGIIEKGYYVASTKRRATHLRPPWVKK